MLAARRRETGGEQAAAPQRRCIVTRRRLPTERLIRFVVGPRGTVVPDVAARLPGRGLWLTARRDIVAAACKGNAFARAARVPVVVAPDLAEHVERLLLERALGYLGLARRAGRAAVGFQAARDWVRRGRAGVLITAADAGADGVAKLRALAPGMPQVTVFSSEDLARALGRARVVHVALAPGRLAEALVREGRRLAAYRAHGDGVDETENNRKDR